MDLTKKRSLKKELLKQPDMKRIKIAILCGSTIGEVKTILELFLLQQKIEPIFYEGQYDRYYEDVVFDNPSLREFAPEIIYIHTTTRNVDFDSIDTFYQKLEIAWNNINEKYNSIIIQNNFEMLPYRLMGNADVYRDTGYLNKLNVLNEKLYTFARNHDRFYINDIQYLAASFGLERWWDNTYWYMYKYALSLDAIPHLCNSISLIIKSLLGMNKKALVLDLDNTLWGGVIGDDGPDAIELGLETPAGMAFMDFQKYISKLAELGIILNVASKNNENTALMGFGHPSSQLNKDNFISIKANWLPKYTNIQDIANELNISVDSMVFIDDNPVERDIVKKFLPAVSVVDIKTPEHYISALDKCGYFEVTALTKDDANRNDYYKLNKMRFESENQFTSYNEYLLSLDMKCYIDTFNNINSQRVTQLINKTNQFNFTTKRYIEVESLTGRSDVITLCARLVDRFGDNGIVTVLIADIDNSTAIVDLWVMSCRVFKRNLEYIFFEHFVTLCIKRGVEYIRGIYIPSPKNKLVEEFYGTLGFEVKQKDDDKAIWELDISRFIFQNEKCMEVIINE